MAWVRQLKWAVALFLLFASSHVAAQVVIHTTRNYPAPAGGQYAVDTAASSVIEMWIQVGGRVSPNNDYTIIWNNAVAETYIVKLKQGSGWLANAVPGTKRDLGQNVAQGPLISNCGGGGNNTLTYYITTIWYVVSTGEIVDVASRMVTFTLDNSGLGGNC